MVRLRKQARHCNFGEALCENLRDQPIKKLPDVKLKKLRDANNITLEAALDKVWKWEASRERANLMVPSVWELGGIANVVEETFRKWILEENLAKHVSTVSH